MWDKVYYNCTGIANPRRVDLLVKYELLKMTMKIRYLGLYDADEENTKRYVRYKVCKI